MMQKLLLIVGGLLISWSVAMPICANAEEKIGVVVSILPLAEFTEAVGGEKVNVSVMIPPGANPHVYEPSPEDLKRVALAKVYVKVGTNLEFELSWMEKLLGVNQHLVLCDASKGVEEINTPSGEHEHTHHGHETGHDPHIWLSPTNAEQIVRNILDTLVTMDAANADYYRRNAEEYIRRLREVDAYIQKKLQLLKVRSFIVFHPAWGYFADRYDLEQVAIEYEGKEPSAKELAMIIKKARLLKIKSILASPQFSRRSVEVIAGEIKGKVELADPLAKDYIGNLIRVTDVIAGANAL